MTRIKTERNGRGTDGRFALGNAGGPGRPRGSDFRRIVRDQAEARGLDIEDAVWQVFEALLRRARKGDVQAAKLLLDRLCDSDPVMIDMVHQPLSTAERARRVQALLSAAAARKELVTTEPPDA